MAITRQPNGIYKIEFQLLGERVHQSARTSSRKAALELEDRLRQEVRSRRARPADRERPRILLGEAIQRYLVEHLEPQCATLRSFRSTKALLNKLEELLGGARRRVEDIGPADIREIKEVLRARGRKPATVNQYLAYLRALLRKAELEWEVEVRVPPIKLIRLRNARCRGLTSKQGNSLFAALRDRPSLSDLVEFLLGTGSRLREATGLTWERVSADNSRLTFVNTKNGSNRTIPVSPKIQALLARRRRETQGDCQHVLPYASMGKERQYKSPHGAFRTACRRAGLDDLRIHDLRHAFASALVSRGVPLLHVSRLLGHKDIRMTERYSHLAVDDLEAALRYDGPETPVEI